MVKTRRSRFQLVASLLMAAALAASLIACTPSDAPPASATVQDYSFPVDGGVVYTYKRFRNTTYDTVSARLYVGQLGTAKNMLVDIKTDSVLMYMDFTHDANGNYATRLSTDTSSILVLDGQLDKGRSWMADPAHNITATIIDHYDDYWILPDHPQPNDQKIHFPDVLMVQYRNEQDDPGTYTIRFFARDRGLVLERQFFGHDNVISSLQVLNIQYPS